MAVSISADVLQRWGRGGVCRNCPPARLTFCHHSPGLQRSCARERRAMSRSGTLAWSSLSTYVLQHDRCTLLRELNCATPAAERDERTRMAATRRMGGAAQGVRCRVGSTSGRSPCIFSPPASPAPLHREHLDGEPSLRRFMGKPWTPSPKARLKSWLGWVSLPPQLQRLVKDAASAPSPPYDIPTPPSPTPAYQVRISV